MNRIALSALMLPLLLLGGGILWLSLSAPDLGSDPCAGVHVETREDYESRLRWISWQKALLPAIDGIEPYVELDQVLALCQSAPEHLTYMKAVLTDPDAHPTSRGIVSGLTHCLPLEQRLDIIAYARDALTAGQMSPETIRSLLYAGPEWGEGLALAYRDERVKQLLTSLAQTGKLPQSDVDSIESLLSGTRADMLYTYELPADPAPKLYCADPSARRKDWRVQLLDLL
jgi:hypothetical protein